MDEWTSFSLVILSHLWHRTIKETTPNNFLRTETEDRIAKSAIHRTPLWTTNDSYHGEDYFEQPFTSRSHWISPNEDF